MDTVKLRVVNDVGFNNDKVSFLALLDLFTALDTIDHSILFSFLFFLTKL